MPQAHCYSILVSVPEVGHQLWTLVLRQKQAQSGWRQRMCL